MLSRYIYIQVFKDRFVVRDAGNPVGEPMEARGAFSQPRLLLGNFDAALTCLKPLLLGVRGSFIHAPFTYAVIHPAEQFEGGLAEIEQRAFAELVEQAGAAKVVVWTGPQLSNLEVIEKLKK
ncbi:MAG: hypothetical protein A2X30_07580 [Elusimicrobia bacterium GWB2_63_16]|nr:MAG: hypothetical protein A2X30_07580 [Elusimicrobia bacterium GWB2_63_16]